MEPLRLLAIYAHPDDEGAAAAGALALNAESGGESWLICATRGEVGEISPESNATPETLGEVREQELRAVTAALGIHDPIFLDYRDSGMAGTPENEDFRSLHQADGDEVVQKIVDYMRVLRPDVVLTFAEDGMYGHPDHMAISRATKRAVAEYAKRATTTGDYAGPSRLFYGVIVREWIREFMRAAMENSPEFAEQSGEAREWGTPLEEVTLVIDTTPVAGKRRKATASHVSQMDEMMKRFASAPDEAFGREAYLLAWDSAGENPRKLKSFLDGAGV